MASEAFRDSGARFPPLVAATAIGVYLLIVVGATTAITDAAAACPTWPACNGHWLVPLDDPALVVAWGHRVVALFVGVLVTTTTVMSWVYAESMRVRGALAVSFVLYPVQVGIGAMAATADSSALLSGVHLLVGTVIFAGLAVGLAWTLERRYTGDVEVDATAPDTVPDQASEPQRPTGLRATVGAYARMTKPRLMWLLCLVAAAGMALAAGPDLDVGTVVATLAGGVLAIGASGTFNHVLERDVDARMARTADRPVATRQVPIRNALAFAALLTVVSVGVFLTVNLLAAVLGLVAIVFYSVVYTLVLKPNTVQNTVIGGFAGALPALIGWAAVTGEVGLPALALAGVIFLWTPAHFYNLALAYKEDYARGGFPMMPVVRGDVVTRKHILLYLAATLLGASVLGAADALGWLYAATSVVFGALFLWAVLGLNREGTRAAAFRSFHASNAYLGFLLLAVIVDALAI